MERQHKFSHFFLSVMLLTMSAGLARSQDRCGVVEQTAIRRNKKSLLESDNHFESWLKEKKERASNRANASETHRIPVVVHVIHKGDAIGTGANVSDAQIVSQIAVLNRDFNRLNADASNTPSEFQSVAGSLAIEFILATQSPDGLSTTGIIRAKGTKNQWTVNDDETLKAISYWPAEDYLNIWVTDLSSTLLGYAQFPISDLDGLEDAEDNRLTDGVVIDYTVFGSNEDGTFSLSANFNRGRTTTHEVGHFLGLRHIWGDDNGSCGGNNDYVSDTPDQGNNSSGCPSDPQTSCSVHTMFQNYMDYTNDICMNLFTQEQAARMLTVLENSPRRLSLLNSIGLRPLYANDFGIAQILNPDQGVCDGSMIPTIVVKNFGTQSVTTAKLQFSLNGNVVETKEFSFSPALKISETAEIMFGAISMSPGNSEITFQVILTNSLNDEGYENNTMTGATFVPFLIETPFKETFTAMPDRWGKDNVDGGITWATTLAPNHDASNTAAYLNFFEYTNGIDEIDALISPVIDLSTATAPYLYFDVAYAQRGSQSDGLKVFILTGCENVGTAGTQIYFKEGASLSTTTSQTSSFVPTGDDQWRSEVIDLSAYAGHSQIQIGFTGVNQGGNNLYIDNVSIVKEVFENVSISSIINPRPVTCVESAIPEILVSNPGNVAIHSIAFQYAVNNGAEYLFNTPAGFVLLPGKDTTITLEEIQLVAGHNTLSVSALQPNSVKDIDTTDNHKSMNIVVNTSSDIIPLRQNFDDNTYQSTWSMVNPYGGNNWAATATNFGQSMYFSGSQDSSDIDEGWLVTPILDFSETTTASLFFNYAFTTTMSGTRTSAATSIKILASLDCGQTYEQVVYDGLQQPAGLETSSALLPTNENDWTKQYVKLNDLVGNAEIRFAFLISNSSGGVVYIDNIEFFLSDNAEPLITTEPFVIYGTDGEGPKDFMLTFNLDQRHDVKYDLVDMTGRIVLTEELEDVLNQTYTVTPTETSTGIYILRMRIGNELYSRRVFIGP